MLISRDIGSWFFLGAILTTAELLYDSPFEFEHCGTCTRCLDACPTNAFPKPHVLDANKCISYLTIERRDKTVSEELRSAIGDWVFGCDICQDVCPWNNKAALTTIDEFFPDPRNNPLNIEELFKMDEDAFRKRFRKTPMWRTKPAGLRRNAEIVRKNEQ